MSLNIGVVGATGMVGEEFLQLMNERNFPISNLKLFASDSSKGKVIFFRNQQYLCEVLKPGCFKGLDLVFFSSGDDISLEWAPHAVECGAFAIDNSAAFRMNTKNKLIVPEINGDLLPDKNHPEVIANPNCSTIQLVMALAPLARDFGIHRVQVSTYQSVSGAGKAGKEELIEQTQACLNDPNTKLKASIFAHPIAFNTLPHIGSFNDQGFCSEEVKIMEETKKILNMPQLHVSAFAVRVPTLNGHSEAAWVSLDKEASQEDVMRSLSEFPGLSFVPQSTPESYPFVTSVDQKYDVHVGRLHKDPNDSKTWIMWIVADNIRKGAALNGLQIAERIYNTNSKNKF